jgi:hypothetical protein
LGILAAIAIPALTGYIAKAEWMELELKVKTAKTAFQTMMNEQLAQDGDFTVHGYGQGDAGDFFQTIENGGRQVGGVWTDAYVLNGFSAAGLAEFESLTAGKDTVKVNPPVKYLRATTDSSFVIKEFRYIQDGYFGADTLLLCAYYESVSDPLTASLISTGMKDTVTDGYNIYKQDWSSGASTYERLN